MANNKIRRSLEDIQIASMQKMIDRSVYCKLCGGQIVPRSTDENGYPVDYQWEMQFGFHQKCYSNEMQKLQAEARKKAHEARNGDNPQGR